MRPVLSRSQYADGTFHALRGGGRLRGKGRKAQRRTADPPAATMMLIRRSFSATIANATTGPAAHGTTQSTVGATQAPQQGCIPEAALHRVAKIEQHICIFTGSRMDCATHNLYQLPPPPRLGLHQLPRFRHSIARCQHCSYLPEPFKNTTLPARLASSLLMSP